MELLELTLPTPAENLALDDALLQSAEQGTGPGNVLRLWESDRTFVVVGRGSKVAEEVDFNFCNAHDIEVLRRISGGATVVTGPGCLMYAVVLSTDDYPEASGIDQSHAYVLDRIADSISQLGQPVKRAGTSDLVLPTSDDPNEWRKISGNSMRKARRHFLYHGTILYNMDLQLVSNCLGTPPRMPDYRQRRSHEGFVAKLDASREALVSAIKDAWPLKGDMTDWPKSLVEELVATKYSLASWHERH
ncbi:MAG: lipoate--protein ligase family protein [Planctomycetota bacterium]